MTDINEIIKYTSGLNLLFVDDDKESREAGLFLFEDIFKSIIIAEDGFDGIEKFQNNNIDLIITDIDMPNLNGLDMIENIRQTNKEIPIVILSAHIKTDFFIRSIKLNIKGYLLKPIDLGALLDILTNVISTVSLKIETLKNTKLQEQLKQSHTYLKSIVDSVHDPIMAIKEDYSIALMNNVLKENLKYFNILDINNPKCYEISHNRETPCDDVNHPCPLKDVIESKKPITVMHNHYDKKKNMFPVEVVATPLFDSEQNCIGIIESSRDISAHVDLQNKLRQEKDLFYHQAHHDTLTGLANRILFDDRLGQAILRADRNKTKIALLFIDLNKFKQINDLFGHKAGDTVLKIASNIMQKKMRKDETLARIGGDEFSIIMENIDTVDNASILAQKLIQNLETPIEYEGHSLNISASIGISIYPDDATEGHKLLRYADIAMYEAKNNKQDIAYFSQNLKR